MIRIDAEAPSGDEYEAWRKRAVEKRDNDITRWRGDKKPNPGPKPNQKLWSEFKKMFLEKLFHDKCAYCEANHGSGHAPHVEHYRPKLAVTEARNVVAHPGYFWLAYEWENLILSCNNCNGPHPSMKDGVEESHPGKWNEFKIRGRRVSEPSDDPAKWQEDLKAEEPLLLHPYFDNPPEHLYFNEDGTVHHLTDKGEETIEVCELNRMKLVEARKRAREKVYRRIDRIERLARILQEEEGEEEGKNPDLIRELKTKIDALLSPKPSDEFSAWLNFWVRHRTRKYVAATQVDAALPTPIAEQST